MPSPSPAPRVGAHRDHGFHPLRVARVVHETDDARSFVLDVPPELRDAFSYQAGQFCTFRVTLEGEAQHRCYSMSSAPEVDDELQVTVKRVPGGLVSNWMNDELTAGSVIDVAPPSGVFVLDQGDGKGEDEGEGEGDVVAYAGGSGITPVFSIAKAALAGSERRVRLLYANRDRPSTIFAEALDALAEQHPDRLTVVHHHDVVDGFVGPEAATALLAGARRPQAFVCGPGPFMDIVEDALLAAGLPPEALHIERFSVDDLPLPGLGAEAAPEPEGCQVTIELDGQIATTEHRPGTTILQTARQLGMSPPFSCEMGNCATCMAKLVEGTVSMKRNTVLDDDEVAEGWVLTCQSVPTSSSVRVAYEEG